MFQLSAFTFGGGYVIVSLMRKIFVDKLKWISEEEMLDFIAIAQSSPGAMAINASFAVGYRMAGLAGAVIAIIGTVLPPLIVITVISFFYQSFQSNIYVRRVLTGMQAGIAAVIADVVFDMALPYFKSKQALSIVIMILSFIVVTFLNVNVLFVVISCILIGIILTIIRQRMRARK